MLVTRLTCQGKFSGISSTLPLRSLTQTAAAPQRLTEIRNMASPSGMQEIALVQDTSKISRDNDQRLLIILVCNNEFK